jgi:hypothetical protein
MTMAIGASRQLAFMENPEVLQEGDDKLGGELES